MVFLQSDRCSTICQWDQSWQIHSAKLHPFEKWFFRRFERKVGESSTFGKSRVWQFESFDLQYTGRQKDRRHNRPTFRSWLLFRKHSSILALKLFHGVSLSWRWAVPLLELPFCDWNKTETSFSAISKALDSKGLYYYNVNEEKDLYPVLVCNTKHWLQVVRKVGGTYRQGTLSEMIELTKLLKNVIPSTLE